MGHDTPEQDNRPKVFTVTEFTRALKRVVEETIGYVAVRGEISNFRRQFSGHCYFTLKDESCQLQIVMFRREAGRLKFVPDDGLEAIVFGRATVYEARGQYQLVAEAMEPAGVGALQLAFEQLKERLLKEGLFDFERKKALPAFPRRIGIVTSPTGAALRDFLNIVRRRFSGVDILVYPSAVQGPDAPAELVRGLQTLDAMADIDVIVLVRGGGSLEDLWAFNNEELARAIAAAKKPVVCGVGHETDFTIADFTADLRAPTPSAAAELVVANRADVMFRLNSARDRLVVSMRGMLAKLRTNVEFNRKTLREPARRIGEYRLRVDDLALRLARAVRISVRNRRKSLVRLAAHLDALSPLNTLRRGYAVVMTVSNHRVVRNAQAVAPGEELLVRLAEGSLHCRVTGRGAEMFLPFDESPFPARPEENVSGPGPITTRPERTRGGSQ